MPVESGRLTHHLGSCQPSARPIRGQAKTRHPGSPAATIHLGEDQEELEYATASPLVSVSALPPTAMQKDAVLHDMLVTFARS